MWIKICGVTGPADAAMIAAAGADAIGLNFYPGSKRCVDSKNAAAIQETVGAALDLVGVFVNATAQDVARTVTQFHLAAAQFHGDETVETIAEFHRLSPATAIIRAFRVGDAGTAAMNAEIGRLKQTGVPLAAVLVDAMVAGEYGGTGHQVRSSLLQDRPTDWPPLILAGGLTPATVTEAAAAAEPWGVDTASGVESAPGVKCARLVRAFMDALSPQRGAGPVRLRET